MKLSTAARLVLQLGIVAGLLCLCANPAQTQDPKLKPTFGAVKLKAGFTPDPFVKKDIEAGGPIQTNLGGVTAWVAKEPDFRLNYEAGTFPLTFRFKSDGDTTLLINTPDGKWLADDDGDGFPNPKIKIATPKSGVYNIWVGTIEQNKNPKGTLSITELN